MWQRDLINEGIDPDDYEDPSKDDEAYKCGNSKCEAYGDEWAVHGWFPPDYYFSDWDGGFADVFCVEYAEDAICGWCEVPAVRKHFSTRLYFVAAHQREEER